MVDLNERVLDTAEHRGENLLPKEVLSLVERYHGDETPGAEREVVEAYATALADRNVPTEIQDPWSALDERRTDSETWVGDDAVYELPSGRLSTYPANWHERLAGSNDPRSYLRFLQGEAAFEPKNPTGSPGIPRERLLDVMSVVGHVDRQEAKAAVERLRREGEVVEDADQHPDANVYLADQVDYDRADLAGEDVVDRE
ncbi:hypothetical protein ACFQPA_09885 [Halomarina halobia]|uniref:Uncharacterized protein n=1 Tax=Halomarina halobia TaxID=3033386 RepID=A0ABD6AAJ4_9EURY|nr:hypothetical protein [Halomarina sp. PSR21]